MDDLGFLGAGKLCDKLFIGRGQRESFAWPWLDHRFIFIFFHQPWGRLGARKLSSDALQDGHRFEMLFVCQQRCLVDLVW